MSHYLTIPHIQVQAANLSNSNLVTGGPQLMAAHLLAEALARNAQFRSKVTGILYVHHHITPLGEKVYGVFRPQQRRAAAFTFTNKKGKDYSSTNPHALSLQPTASAHLQLSLVIELSGYESPAEPVDKFLRRARFAGGSILNHGPVVGGGSIEEATEGIRSGYVILDRRDLMTTGHGATPVDRLVTALGQWPSAGDDNHWLSATCVGYAGLSPFENRAGIREGDKGYQHAFCEPLIGLIQFQPWRTVADDLFPCLWRPRWLQEDVYVVEQGLGCA